MKQGFQTFKQLRSASRVVPPREYAEAIESYTARGLAKIGSRTTGSQLNAIQYVDVVTAACHAEMALLDRLHHLSASTEPDARPVVYFGNTKLACLKCAWYFTHYALWEGARFTPSFRGSHALAPTAWRVPGIDELNKALSPGILELGRYNNQGTGTLVHQDMVDYGSDSEPEED